MKITFCLPTISNRPVGGFKVVFEYANHLVNRGHDVTIVFFANKNFNKITKNQFLKHVIGKTLNPFRPKWFILDERIKKITTAYTDDAHIPDSDVIFATAVETTPMVSSLSLTKGKKIYLIQDFENWNVSDEEVLKSYSLGMKNIAISTWLYKLVSQHSDVVLLSNAINTEYFYVKRSISERCNKNLALLYHIKEHKGFDVAFEAINLVREKIPEIKLNLFGTFKKPDFLDESWMTYTKSASPKQLQEIYNNSAIFLCASVNEGFGLTGAEAMASGCALASTSYEGVFEYAEDGVNALLSPVNDAKALASNIIRLIEDDDLRIKLATNGSKKLKSFSWQNNVDKLESILEETVG